MVALKKKLSELSDDEKELFVALQDGNEPRIRELLADTAVRTDCTDASGMTPLSHACFKSNVSMVRLLIARSADVNTLEHSEGYTPLMFAALAGSTDICKILLEAGAKTYRTNRINKTASEMAAFTGQHACVALINNYLSLDNIEAILSPKGSTTPPRIPLEHASLIHDLSRTYNVHPVRTVLYVIDNPVLLSYRKEVIYVLEELLERQMKQRETNEIMAFKLHVILMTLKDAFESLDKQLAIVALGCPVEKSDTQILEAFIRFLLKAETKHHFAEQMERLIRRAVQKWPYHHSVLFQTILKQMSSTTFGDEPDGISIIHQVVLGHRAVVDNVFCAACGEPNALKRCAKCKAICYCSPRCQKLHWSTHKRWCESMRKSAERVERINERLALEHQADDATAAAAEHPTTSPDEHDQQYRASDIPVDMSTIQLLDAPDS